MTRRNVLLLPGDGIGPEVMAEAEKVIAFLNAQGLTDIALERDLIGGCSYDAHGVPLSDPALATARAADGVLLGAVGGPKWDGVDYAVRPEAGLLKIRKELDLFANLRVAKVFDALIDASSLKPDLVRGLDMLIVRELTGGVYFGEPRGVEDLPDGTGRRAVDTQVYSTPEIVRIAEVAFDLARKRDNRLCSVEKANVMNTGRLWREDVTEVHKRFADVELSHMYADNCAMQIVRAPKQFDVIVTDNLFGDVLSDCAAMLTGSLGMLPSASLGTADAAGKRASLYEPVHGSAPDIAGQGIANPSAMILSLAMMLRYSLDDGAHADLVEAAVEDVLSGGLRTADIMVPGATKASTSEMGDAVIERMKARLS